MCLSNEQEFAKYPKRSMGCYCYLASSPESQIISACCNKIGVDAKPEEEKVLTKSKFSTIF